MYMLTNALYFMMMRCFIKAGLSIGNSNSSSHSSNSNTIVVAIVKILEIMIVRPPPRRQDQNKMSTAQLVCRSCRCATPECR